MPACLQKGKLVVPPSASAKAPSLTEAAAGGGKLLTIPTKQTDVQLREMLAPYDSTKLLHFSSLDGAFGAFAKSEDADLFQVWCGVGQARGGR